MDGAVRRKVFYLSHADEHVYGIIRSQLPAGFELVTLEENADPERLQKIVDAQVVICAATPLTRPMIEAAEKLELVHHQGVGYQDTVDTAALAERDIKLALTPSGTTIGVAEHTVLLTLAVLRRLPFADAELRQGRWHINALRPVSRELYGRTVGYIGMGRIGQAVAERMKVFGATGVYVDDPAPLPDARTEELGLKRGTLDEVFAAADILSLHTPATPQTRHIINAATIERMQHGAVVINTARGQLVDEAALYRALAVGRLGGAGLDVFETEPPALDNPLLSLPNVVVTPHISAGTRDALQAKMRALFDNVARFYRGEPLQNAVDLKARR